MDRVIIVAGGADRVAARELVLKIEEGTHLPAAMRDLETGIVYVNHGTTGAETHLPFGGTRGTGNGHREAGHTMLDPFTEWKSIYVDCSGRLQRAQIDNA